MKKIFLLGILLFSTSFLYPQVPGIPIIISPADSATICPPYIFDWYDVPTATTYEIQFSLNINFTALIIDENVNISQYTLPNGVFSGTAYHFWRVRALNSYGAGQWTATRRVKTGSLTNPPVLLIPPNGVTLPLGNITFDWMPVSGATNYIFQLSKSQLFDSLVVNDTTPLGTITLQENTTYYWRVCGMNSCGAGNWSSVWHFTTLNQIGISLISTEIPTEYKLYNNYPNPFNPSTNIKYQIKAEVSSQYSEVRIIIYDILGKEIEKLVNEKQSPGTYEINFDGSNLSNGIYFYTLRSGDFTDTKRMMLIK